MRIKVIIHDGYVKIDYQHNGRTRLSTGVAIDDKNHLTANGELKKSVPDYKEKQQTINLFVRKAQRIVDDFKHENEELPTKDQFLRIWREQTFSVAKSEYLLEHYNEFYITKEIDFSRNDRKANSIKDYRNLRYYLEDYETANSGNRVLVEEITKDWLIKFVVFMQTERKDYDTSKENGGKYWSRGGLRGSTIKKRLSIFKYFLRTLEDKKLLEITTEIEKFFRELDNPPPAKSSLTKDEVNQLYKYDFEDEKLDYIKDIFVLSCFTGMRWGDIRTLEKKHIKKVENIGYCINKNAFKTKQPFSVPINQVVDEIIKRYDFDFARYDNANFNKYLKILLEQTGWFYDEMQDPETGETLERWQCISIHSGRDSFCTMMMTENVPLNEIMTCTGHKSVSNLNKYIDLNAKRKMNYTNSLVI